VPVKYVAGRGAVQHADQSHQLPVDCVRIDHDVANADVDRFRIVR
jgi:hypothetical protein